MEPIYEPIGSKREIDISYQPVSADHSPNPGGHYAPIVDQPRRHSRRRIIWYWVSHLLSLLWLAPIATLLYLNLSHHVIGASVWCPRGDCNAESTTDGAIRRAQKLDRQDHDTNGALQFVAKALEVWFIFVATSFVYDIGILFAKKGRGLPVGYLLSHLEFTDLRYLFSPLLWTSPWPHGNSVPEKQARIVKLYIFAIITALLTILANLMGPVTAVLVLPTLQWIDTPHIMDQTFNGTGIMYAPNSEYLSSNCNASQLLARNYSCTSDVYGPILDAWAAQGVASVKQFNNSDGSLVLGVSQEASLQFTYNATQGELIWVANRQVLREMSHEFLKTLGWYTTNEPPEYPDKRYNNSLQTILQRQGPSLGMQSNCYSGNVTDLMLDDNLHRWIRCYTGWTTLDGLTSYTKCLRLGTGFKETNYNAQFDLENKESYWDTGVGVYFADKATYYSETDDFGSGIKACLTNETSISCDWDRVFDSANPNLPPELRNTTVNVGVISYQIPGDTESNNRVWCDHVTYQSFPTYSIDTSPRSNPEALVMLNDLPANANRTTPAVVSPDWFLAAWSVDNEGTLDGNRQIVKDLIRVLPVAFDSPVNFIEFYILHVYALGQSLSMVDYDSFPAPTGPNSMQAREAAADKIKHPIFHTWATIHVWAYGLSSRTSKLGVLVVVLGSACVLARFFLGLFTGIQERSTVEVLAAAFEHRHQGEFEGLEEESHLAKVRYQVVEDGEGKQRFIPEKRTSRWSHATSM
ncbi:MAG: hypothetical protein L6R39_001013 [Caloplaca ligustica]|nr:MAG: hypothetical protein L6R39_001013 [Caloplaca ligustica]